jgi:metallophosphoesterase (TIGR00282 family)
MKILFLGDVIGRSGRDAVMEVLPRLKTDYKLDAVIVNVENSAHGFGVTPQIADDFIKAGVDCMTTGNHVWDQREIMPYIEREGRLLRPVNFPAGAPGRGVYVIETARGQKIVVANIMARLFMDALDDPFVAADKIASQYVLGRDAQAIFIDFHGEASSEKAALGKYLDGRVSFLIGTHTHTPTADTRILPKGTGYQTDAGMCGCYDSVIGMDADLAVGRFVRKIPGERLRPAEGPVTVCGIIFETDDKTGLCKNVWPLRMGGVLSEQIPPVAA